jgi:hypothetical protein
MEIYNRNGDLFSTLEEESTPRSFLETAEYPLKGLHLAHLDFRAVHLSGKLFRDVDFSGANFCGSILNTCTFQGCSFFRAHFRGADLDLSVFEDCDLRFTDFSGSRLNRTCFADSCTMNVETNFRGVNLFQTVWPGAWGGIIRLDFGQWPVTITPTHTTVGCYTASNQFWLEAQYHLNTLEKTDPKAISFWNVYGDIIQEAIRLAMEGAKSEG